MIKFFRKKENYTNNTKSLIEIFPWLSSIDDNYLKLCNQDINLRIAEVLSLNNYFQSQDGKEILKNLKKKINFKRISKRCS